MIRIGKIVATHGINGAVIMTHIAGNRTWLKTGNALMLEVQKGSMIPYFVAQIRATSDEEFILNFEDMTSPQEAKRLVGKAVYADEKLLESLAKESPLMWIGFTISDAHYGNLGTLDDVMQTGAQWIGKIEYKGNEVLLPLVDATLVGIDIRSKILKTRMPEGLLEVYE